MKKRLISLLSCAAIAVTLINMPLSYADEGGIKIYVSPTGNDSNEGSFEKPLKTLDAARIKISRMRSGDIPAEVLFRGGEYRFSSGVVFSENDSGTKENPIVYKAYNGEEVLFKGSVEVDPMVGRRVIDNETLSRFYEEVRNRIVCYSLSDWGLTASMIRMPANVSGWNLLSNGEVNQIYVDGKEQILSQWPNGEGVYTRYESVISANTIPYTDPQPNRWGNAKNFWLGGYPSWDWYYLRQSVTKVDTENKTLTINDNVFTSHQSKRWKVFNLLEEIDIPGEYYIDPENMLLYFYPPYPLTDTKMEISWLNLPMLSFNRAKNIRFEGITITQTRGDAVNTLDIDNIDFINCRFVDVLGHAIYMNASALAQTDKDYWQRQRINGSYNVDIKGCDFNNIGGGAIEMNGGDLDTLTPSNNVIEDCMFYRCTLACRDQCAVMLRGCGCDFIHNNMSRIPFQAVRGYGNDFNIQYNEIHDVDQESDDCGAIYFGRNTLQRGHDISYNFLHDLYSTETLPFGFQNAIYWDDEQTGIKAHHNIIKDVRCDIGSNGAVDFDWNYNISINMPRFAQRFINGGSSVNHNAGTVACGYKFSSFILNPALYYEKYEHLYELINAENSEDPKLARFNNVIGNLVVNAAGSGMGTNTEKYGNVKGNLWVDECSDFVDPMHYDYRLKSDSETAAQVKGVLTDEFDIEKIGLQREVILNEKTAPFRQIYPRNGMSAVGYGKISFVWEEAFGATNYRLVIARDPDMKDIVYDETVPYPVKEVSGLSANSVYYWKVYAMNRSRDLLSTWDSSSNIYSFRTAMYTKPETSSLKDALSKVSGDFSSIGEGDEVAQYPVGTIDRINRLIKRAETLQNSKIGIVSQKTIDSVTKQILAATNSVGMLNKGYLDIKEFIEDKNGWGGNVNADGKTVTVESDGNTMNIGGTTKLGYTTGSCIYSFDAKIDTSVYSIIAIAKDNTTAAYNANNTGYSICMKSDLTEFQLSTGTAHTVEETVYKSIANDGKFHHIEFGFINIGIGNIVVFNVDGEAWFEYLDVYNCSVTNQCQLSLFAHNTAGEKTVIRPAEKTSSPEDFEKLMNRCVAKAAVMLLDKFETDEDVMLFKAGSGKIVTPKGVYDVSYAPNKVIDGRLMIAADRLFDIIGVKAEEEGGKCYIKTSSGRKEIASSKENGHTMIAIEDTLKALGKASVWTMSGDMLLAGNMIVMNNIPVLEKEYKLLSMLEQYKGDRMIN